MQPIIGVTSFLDLTKAIPLTSVPNNYLEAIYAAGGLPIIFPIISDETTIDKYLDTVDGILLIGGQDVSPQIYNENPIKEVNVTSWECDFYEINIIKKAVERKIPILGICRGLQILNIALGGDLYQDIFVQRENTLGHSPDTNDFSQLYHSIKLEKNSIIYDCFKKESILVNSFHHQAIKNLSNKLKATSFSEDGIIESVEYRDSQFVFAVQFHPEGLVEKHKEFYSIFKKLIEASSNN